MGFIHGANRHAEILFPERLDDDMAAEHPVRCLDAFVEHLTLTMLGFQRATPAATAGTSTGVRAPERISRARCRASRRAVVTRSPGFWGIKEGATTQQPEPFCSRERESQEPQGPAS
jgi:hypothetical protein